ncbi:imidazole glycerol phosphate synthase subunit HisH [bacterium]|nr:imidazole glycerol phosphate synthase subunit HisH [bacterium]
MIAVIDYDTGNLKSVSKALEAVGAKVEVTNDPRLIGRAEVLVLPGVGAFYRGMENLKRLNLLPSIFEAVKEGKPLLGICLGLQLLFTESEEHGTCQGLDIIKGKVKKFQGKMKIPHMGWNQIRIQKSDDPQMRVPRRQTTRKCGCPEGRDQIFKGIPDGSYFYFVHSYYVVPDDKNVIAATTEYGIEFTSAIAKDNIFAVQFHPEKSGELGLKILENFLNVS